MSERCRLGSIWIKVSDGRRWIASVILSCETLGEAAGDLRNLE
jgi:hypothetical protein